MIAFKYGVPYFVLEGFWDIYHAMLSGGYGTGPMHASGRYGTGPIGHYFSSLGLHQTLMIAFKYGVPCCVFRDLWDRSHACLSGRYGTGPIGNYFSSLGLHITLINALRCGVPSCVFRDLWDWSHACLSGR